MSALESESAATATRPDPGIADDWFVCITQSPDEPAPAEYLAICTVKADLLAESFRCVAADCGGHPICRPCYDLGVKQGLVAADSGGPKP